MRDLFDDLMSRVERRDPWNEVREEKGEVTEEEPDYLAEFEEDENLDE